MALDHCIDEIIKASGETLTREDIAPKNGRGILDDLEAKIESFIQRNPTASKDEAAIAVAKQAADADKFAALIEKRNRVINLNVKSRLDQTIKVANKGHEIPAFDATSVGSTGNGYGRRRSADAAGKYLGQKLAGPMTNQLRRIGSMKLFQARDFVAQVMHEIWRLSDPENPTLLPREKTSDIAKQAASIIGKYTEMGRVMQNKRGAWIGRLPGYVMRQDHDMMKIRKVTAQQWTDDFIKAYGNDQTFADFHTPQEQAEYTNYLYNAFRTGVHEKDNGSTDFLSGFKGPSNKAKSISQHRVLHANGPDDLLAYHEKYGKGTFIGSVVDGLHRAGRNSALLETWGTNPELMFNTMLGEIRDEAGARGDIKTVTAANAEWQRRGQFKQTNGTANVGGNPTLANVMGNIRGLQTLSSLGQILFSAITDVPLSAGSLRYAGSGYFDAVGSQIANLFEAVPSEAKLDLMDQLGIGLDGVSASIGDRFTSNDGARGVMAKTLETFFKYGGIRWWTDRMRDGSAKIAAFNMAKSTAIDWAHLTPQLRSSLEGVEIGEREWAIIRQTEQQDFQGKKVLTSDGVMGLPDEVIKNYLGDESAGRAAIDAARERLATNMGVFYTNVVDEAVNQPGAYERYVTSWGAPSGTVPGEVARAFMLFKGFGISVARRHFWREVTRTGQWDKAGMAYLIIGTTTMGYAAMQLKAVVNGRNPREWPKDLGEAKAQGIASFLQGGGAGIYGDFLLGDTNRYGGGLAETLGGPTIGQLASLYKMKSELQDASQSKDLKPFRADAVRLIRNNLPFQNFLWTKQALDYLIFYGVQEAMNPGYLRRMESRVKQDNQQTFMLPPSKFASRTAGNLLINGRLP